jgi:alpha-tubulin suppressor-like RCC1 family protein
MRSKILAVLAMTCLVAVLSAATAGAQVEGPVPPMGSAGVPGPEALPGSGGVALQRVSSVTTGYYHGCARLQNTQVRCWGYNGVGELGNDEASTDIAGPVTVVNAAGAGPLTGAAAVAAGEYHSCALLQNTQVRCWGYNDNGQLGDGTDEDRHRPVAVRNLAGTGPLTGVAQITASDDTTCAVLLDGRVRCWGDNSDGQLADGTTDPSPLPVAALAVSGSGQLGGVTQIDAGPEDVCVRLASGQARCWGYNYSGQLGDGTDDDRTRPVVVRNAAGSGPLVNVRRISAGGYHTCAVITDGTARCWGYNGYGQLGDGSEDDRPLPGAVRNSADTGPLRGIAYLDAGADHACARLVSGNVRCWGDNYYGAVGNGVDDDEDVPLPALVRNAGDNGNLAGVTQLQTSDLHTCVRLDNAQARCWGYGQYGTLGNYGDVDAVLPVKVLSGVAG